ncbi:MAG: histidinol-phosphate transaminase [Gammaproteobacteria bacterium]|nr:histidinol-phosphate transaminase [Gammaproteobacteria bacterium]
MSTTAQKLVRPEIGTLKPYVAATYAEGVVRLNANEAPWSPIAPSTGISLDELNRYPDERPWELTARLADFYGVDPGCLLVTRGSSEGIDLLIRSFCRAGTDEVVINPPTFGMYRVYADVQGAKVKEIPLLSKQGFALDIDGILSNWSDVSKLAFICSPNNPTGNSASAAELETLCKKMQGKGLVVIDAAYTEFADYDPTELVSRYDNVVVLRTLSKALGLAGVRCGAVIASPEIIGYLQQILPPYSYPKPCQDTVLAALDPANRSEQLNRIRVLKSERERLLTYCKSNKSFNNVWPSEANFIFVTATDPNDVIAKTEADGVRIRDFSKDSSAPNGFRITVGTPEENDQLINALDKLK